MEMGEEEECKKTSKTLFDKICDLANPVAHLFYDLIMQLI